MNTARVCKVIYEKGGERKVKILTVDADISYESFYALLMDKFKRTAPFKLIYQDEEDNIVVEDQDDLRPFFALYPQPGDCLDLFINDLPPNKIIGVRKFKVVYEREDDKKETRMLSVDAAIDEKDLSALISKIFKIKTPFELLYHEDKDSDFVIETQDELSTLLAQPEIPTLYINACDAKPSPIEIRSDFWINMLIVIFSLISAVLAASIWSNCSLVIFFLYLFNMGISIGSAFKAYDKLYKKNQ
jgi:hypothetical protein